MRQSLFSGVLSSPASAMKTTAFTLFVLATQSALLLLPSPGETGHYHHLRCGSDGTLIHHQPPPLAIFFEYDDVDAFRLLFEPRLEVAAEPEEYDDDGDFFSARSYQDWDPNDLPEFVATDPEYSDIEEQDIPDYMPHDYDEDITDDDGEEEHTSEDAVPHYYDAEEYDADEEVLSDENRSLVGSPVWASSPIWDRYFDEEDVGDDEGEDDDDEDVGEEGGDVGGGEGGDIGGGEGGGSKNRLRPKLKGLAAACFFCREVEVEDA